MSTDSITQLPELPSGRFDVFVGFDLGHGETCLVSLQADDDLEPKPLEVDDQRAFPSALGRVGDEYEVGRRAVTSGDVKELEIGFKTRPIPGTSWDTTRPTIIKFAQVCYQKVSKFLTVEPANLCVLIGRPTGWLPNEVNEYSKVFQEAGLPHPLVVDEAWAALIHSRDSKQIPPERLGSSIVVIDIGSSTTDIAHILDLQVQNDGKDSAGGCDLGAGLIDEYVLEENLRRLPDRQWWEDHFTRDPSERQRALYGARRVKEEYFRAGDLERKQGVSANIHLLKKLELEADEPMIENAINAYGYTKLAGNTWAGAYRDLLQGIRSRLHSPPDFVLLTGGASRMEFTATICREVFGEETRVPLKHEPTPEAAVASGLARTGRWLQRFRSFDGEIEDTFSVKVLKEIITPDLPKVLDAILVRTLKAAFTTVMPACIDDWKTGKTKGADGLAKAFTEKGREWHSGAEANAMRDEEFAPLIKAVIGCVEENAKKIADRYKIPQREKLRLDALLVTDVFYTNFEQWLTSKYYVAFDQTIGKIVDLLQGWGGLIAPFAKGSLWLLGQLEAILVKAIGTAVGGIIDAKEVEPLAQLLAGEFQKQMHEQFAAQKQSVLPWIK